MANGWQKWWKAFEQDAQKVNERLIELAGIEEGYRVLDIATGTGEPAITAAKKLAIKVMFWLLTYLHRCCLLQSGGPTPWV